MAMKGGSRRFHIDKLRQPHGGLDDAGSTWLRERLPPVVFGQPSL
jgi:hypothetical protein